MSPEAFSALFAGIAILVSVVAAIFAASSARSSKKSADAADDLTLISAADFAARAPFLRAEWIAGQWVVTNVGETPAYDIQIQVEPYGAKEDLDLRMIAKGEIFYATPKVLMPDLTLSVSWARNPDGGPHVERRQETYKRTRRDGK